MSEERYDPKTLRRLADIGEAIEDEMGPVKMVPGSFEEWAILDEKTGERISLAEYLRRYN